MRWQRIVFSVTVTEGLLTEVSEKRKGCGRKAIPPVVARILSGDSTSPLTREARTWCGARDSAENLIDGADREQSPPSRLGIVSEL